MSFHLIFPETVPILCGVYCMLEERQAGTTHWLNCTPCTEYYVGRKGRLVQATTGLALSPLQNVMLKERPFFLQAAGLTLHPVQNAMLEER